MRTAPGRSRSNRLARASLGSGIGTIASRLTGLFRIVMIAYALGGAGAAASFNLANNTPNIIHDLVLGGVLAATFVPVLVDRLAKLDRVAALDSISALVTASLVLLVVSTVLLVLAAPYVIDLYTFGASVGPERALAIEWLRYFGPQLFFYGFISLVTALLATRDRFGTVGFAPIANNVVSILVLAVFAALAHRSGSAGQLLHDRGLVAFLGVGTTLGVAVQGLVLIPSLRRSGIHLRFVWRPSDPAIARVLSLSSWTFGFVVANQIAVFVVLALAVHLGNTAVNAYVYAFIFFQLPFAVVATAVVNVATPDLARAWERADLVRFGRRFGAASRKVLALVLPATVGYLLLASTAVPLVIQHGKETAADARLTASVLALFALGLPGYCLYFLAVRALQAMQDTKTAFYLYLVENGINIALALALYRVLGVKGLALSYSIAYAVAALCAFAVLRRRVGSIGGRRLVTSAGRSVVLSLVMAFAVAVTTAVIGSNTGIGGWIRVIAAIVVGLGVYACGAAIAATVGAWQTSRRRGG